MRRVTVLLLGMDEDVAVREGQGDIVVGESASSALGRWVYANRHSLDLEIELITPKGRIVSL
jgi:hypothetical protein